MGAIDRSVATLHERHILKIRIGISTCPNDTFAFHPLLEQRIDTDGFEFDFSLLDVQDLNERLWAGQLDVGKASFHAALKLVQQYGVFSAGSALGFGNGPLLLAGDHVRQTGRSNPSGRAEATQEEDSGHWTPPPGPDSRVLCPGADTTASLLYRLFYPDVGQVQHVIFSEIAPALLSGNADYGVCIHEGRFTYRQLGLHKVVDLGERWQQETGAPLPLGGILGRLELGWPTLQRLSTVIARSVEYALANRQQALPTMQRFAQELNPEVIWAHVDLYVNRWTQELGSVGAMALERLAQQTAGVGLVEPGIRLKIIPPLQSIQSTATFC